jgi:plasmid stabilization system protein ParE
MSYKITLSPAAFSDEQEAYDYYEEQQIGLGERFLLELETYYNKLKVHPQHFSFIEPAENFRSAALPTFPYIIIYEIADEQVYVFAVHNTHKFLNKIKRKI